MNRGWFWPLGDLMIDARLVVRGLDPDHPTHWTHFHLPISEGAPFPTIAKAGVPWMRKVKRSTEMERVYRLRIDELRGKQFRLLPSVALAEVRSGDLIGLMSALEREELRADVRLAVAASHGLSGTRRTKSYRITPTEIPTGEFRIRSVELRPPS